MKPKTQRRTSRWTERPDAEIASPYADGKPVRDIRVNDLYGPGPYEASYDIALGYSHDRPIDLP